MLSGKWNNWRRRKMELVHQLTVVLKAVSSLRRMNLVDSS